MAQQGMVTVNGNLGSDPRSLGNGNTPICSFSLGVTDGYFNRQSGQWVSRPTTWLRVKAFRLLAANIMASLHKGDPVIITGQIGTETWQNSNGDEQSTMVITATNVGHDLAMGRSVFVKNPPRSQSHEPNGGSVAAAPAAEPVGQDPYINEGASQEEGGPHGNPEF